MPAIPPPTLMLTCGMMGQNRWNQAKRPRSPAGADPGDVKQKNMPHALLYRLAGEFQGSFKLPGRSCGFPRAGLPQDPD